MTQTNGDRRTLHLSLGNGAHDMPAHGNGAHPNGATGPGTGGGNGHAHGNGAYPAASPVARAAVSAEPPRGGNGKDPAGAFIDHELRARVDGDIAAFLAAFDAALAGDSQESRAALREATDRLLRAGARTRIELERLEARMPLPPHGAARSDEPAWRHR